MPVPRLERPAARRFAIRATGLARPHATIAAALSHHGYVQIDPINICGRMHDLILRPRVVAYAEGDLMRHLHGASGEAEATSRQPEQRTAFEHHLPDSAILAALELDAWPHLRHAMAERTRRSGAWSGRLSPRERELAKRILDEIGARGPLSSADIVDERRARRVWGAATLVKATMQKLFFHGRLLISRRERGRRVYDLPERVLPSAVLNAPDVPRETTARWMTLLKLRQRRLVRLKRAELPLVEDLVQAVEVEGCRTLHIFRADRPILEAISANEEDTPDVRHLLAPLDPLIYDRALTLQLWDFEYQWEVYTPPAKRKRGYYALPLLSGPELVGHADLRADRAAGRLLVVSRQVRRGHRIRPAITDVARFLGLR